MKTIILLASVLITVSCSHFNNNLSERQAVEDTVNRMFIGVDNKDWPGVQKLFTETVRFDMSSLTNAPEAMLKASDITAGWDKGLKPVEQVHHHTGNFLIEVRGNEADVFCYATATHYKNPAMKKTVTSFVGSYNIHLIKAETGWKINSLKFNKKYVD
ncbi:MAG: nuclear transport factor 2 family protein [Bacteriovorax sp.]